MASKDRAEGQTALRKIAVMGYPCVGKSSLTQRFVNDFFPESYDTTIEDTVEKTYNCFGNRYRLHIIDTAGQKEYSLFPKSCSTGIDGYVIVYAINNRESFELIKILRDKILDNVCQSDIPTIVVGNKLDLHIVEREISAEEGGQLAKSWGAQFVETSAKENQMVEKIFQQLIMEIERHNGNVIRPDESKKACCVS